MANGNGKTQVALDEGTDAVVVRGGIRIEFNADNIAVYRGDVRLYPAGKAPAPEQALKESGGITATVTKQAYNIGDVLPDGWIVGPVSPNTGVVMAIEPVSGALDGYKTWRQGQDHAAELRGQGHANARQPGDNELNAIYNDVVMAGRNGNAKLNTSESLPYGNYWSGTAHPDRRVTALFQYLDGRGRAAGCRDGANARVRCVRDEPGLTLA